MPAEKLEGRVDFFAEARDRFHRNAQRHAAVARLSRTSGRPRGVNYIDCYLDCGIDCLHRLFTSTATHTDCYLLEDAVQDLAADEHRLADGRLLRDLTLREDARLHLV